MRQPSTGDQRWGWWEAAVVGLPAAIHELEPQPGFYRMRRWARQPFWLAVRVWIEDGPIDPETGELLDDERLFCEVDGRRRNPFAEWTWFAGNPITEEEYEWLRATRHLQPTRPPQPKSSR